MLAKHLAWETNSPLWDLSGVYVGSGTLWGSLARAFGPTELNSIIGRAVAGEFLLIIDALDEAEMHAGAEAFDAFLTEIRDMYATARPAPGAVLLGRSETIDYIEMFLGQDVPFSRYYITNFSRDQAYEFIDNRLDVGRVSESSFKPGSQRKRVVVYEEARNRLFEVLEGRLTTDITIDFRARNRDAERQWSERVTAFLGYAPVLEAMAEYLAAHVANYATLLTDLRRMKKDPYRAGDAQWHMLRMIVIRLLEREQAKVVTQFRKVVSDAEWSDWDSLYTPAEQCGRVLARVTHNGEAVWISPELPDSLMLRYSEVLKNALPNHPLLGSVFGYANIVFRDYVHAWGLLSSDPAIVAAVRSQLHSRDYLPSPLLGPFILTASSNDEIVTVEGQDVGFIYESLLTHGETNVYLFAEPERAANVYFGSARSSNAEVFRVRHPDTGIQFWRRLTNASIRGEIDVQLGFPDRNFSLGPNVWIDCAIVEAPARTIKVYTTERFSVHISATTGYERGDVEPELYKFGPGEFSISWDGPRYPWVQYFKSSNQSRGKLVSEAALSDAFFKLCRIAERFATARRLKKPLWGPVAEDVLFSRRIVGHEDDHDAMLSWLVTRKILVKQGRQFFLDAHRLNGFDVHLFELSARVDTPSALRMVQDFASWPGRTTH